MKEYPQPTRAAGGNAAVIEVFPRGRKPARSGTFWPGEQVIGRTRRWDLTGHFADGALVVAVPAHLKPQHSL